MAGVCGENPVSFFMMSGCLTIDCAGWSLSVSSTSPASGSKNPTSVYSSVDLPAPLVPMMPNNSPAFIVRLVLSSISFPLAVVVMPSIFMNESSRSVLLIFSM